MSTILGTHACQHWKKEPLLPCRWQHMVYPETLFSRVCAPLVRAVLRLPSFLNIAIPNKATCLLKLIPATMRHCSQHLHVVWLTCWASWAGKLSSRATAPAVPAMPTVSKLSLTMKGTQNSAGSALLPWRACRCHSLLKPLWKSKIVPSQTCMTGPA